MNTNILLAEDNRDHFNDVFDILTTTHHFNCFPNKIERRNFVSACRQFLQGHENGQKTLDTFINSFNTIDVLIMDWNWGNTEILKDGGLSLLNNYFKQKFPHVSVIFLSVDHQNDHFEETVGYLYVHKTKLGEPFDKSVIDRSLLPAIEYCLKQQNERKQNITNVQDKNGNDSIYVA